MCIIIVRLYYNTYSVQQMEVELGDYSRENKDLLRQLEHQELKLKATTKEMMKEQQSVCVTKCNLHVL